MRLLIVFVFLLGLVSCGGSDASTDLIKEKNADDRVIKKAKFSTVKFGSLEIMTKDLGMMKWDNATKACADLGNEWRLPTKDELNFLFENKDKIEGFAAKFYWSSEEYFGKDAWEQNFNSGRQGASDKSLPNNVRAVRTF